MNKSGAGLWVKLTESHVILACPAVRTHRLKFKARLKGIRWDPKGLSGGGGAKAKLLDRGRKMAVILEVWRSVSDIRVPFEVNHIGDYVVLLFFLSFSWRYRQDFNASGKCAAGLCQYAIELDPCFVVHTLVQCGHDHHWHSSLLPLKIYKPQWNN